MESSGGGGIEDQELWICAATLLQSKALLLAARNFTPPSPMTVSSPLERDPTGTDRRPGVEHDSSLHPWRRADEQQVLPDGSRRVAYPAIREPICSQFVLLDLASGDVVVIDITG